DGDSNQLPTISIVASYHTFGAAPALSVGRYDILFGLTSGGPYNYNGIQIAFQKKTKTPKGLSNVAEELGVTVGLKLKKINVPIPKEFVNEAAVVKSVKVLAESLARHIYGQQGKNIDILADNSSLSVNPSYIRSWLDLISRPPRGLSNVAEELGVTVGLKLKKINVPIPEEFVNEAAVVKSVKVLAESLARHIYGQQGKNIDILADNSSLSVNPSYIRSWLDLISRPPRVAPFLSKDNAFIMALKKELADQIVEVNLQHDVLDGMFTFYDSTVSTLQIYHVNVTFDLLLLLGLGSYLITLFSLIVITTGGLDDLISPFRCPLSRKVKSV
nr:nicalin-1 [Tanacetum cinerariifolium]